MVESITIQHILHALKNEGWSSGTHAGARIRCWHDRDNKLLCSYLKLKETYGKDETFQQDSFPEYGAVVNLKNVWKPRDTTCMPSECDLSRGHLL